MLSADAIPANYTTATLYSLCVDDDGAADATNIFVTMFKSMKGAFSTLVAQNNHLHRTYRMSDAKPRTPIASGNWNFDSSMSGPPLPTEVALCMSFHAPPVSGLPQARRRGRIYVGPLNTTYVASTGRPDAALISLIAKAGRDALDDFDDIAGIDWAVHSTKGAEGEGVAVTAGWVDNEYDTQRRRGREATTRTIFNSVAPL